MFFNDVVSRFLLSVKAYGFSHIFLRGVRLYWFLTIHRLKKILFRNKYQNELKLLETKIAEHKGWIDILHIPIGWKTVAFQRYQHLSLQFSHLGGLSLYGGHPTTDSDIFVFKEVNKDLIVFNAQDIEITKHIFSLLEKHDHPQAIRIESIDPFTTIEDVNRLVNQGFTIIYEYIDEISKELSEYMPDLVFKRHEALMRDERIVVVATSEQLFENAQKYRSKKLLLSTNGVDIEHWKNKSAEPPNDLKSALTGRIIVGYHGALAKWIDFDLLYMIADHGDYELVLIGYEHDQEFEKSGLKKHPRVHFLGNKSYFDLNLYVPYYDIAILPFKKTKFTDGVSPIKIFEYMAASKPIVATDLRECRKYQSCLIAKTKEEFILQLSTAIKLRNNPDYLYTLDGEAKENTWYTKAIDVLDMAGIIKAKTSASPR